MNTGRVPSQLPDCRSPDKHKWFAVEGPTYLMDDAFSRDAMSQLRFPDNRAGILPHPAGRTVTHYHNSGNPGSEQSCLSDIAGPRAPCCLNLELYCWCCSKFPWALALARPLR